MSNWKKLSDKDILTARLIAWVDKHLYEVIDKRLLDSFKDEFKLDEAGIISSNELKEGKTENYIAVLIDATEFRVCQKDIIVQAKINNKTELMIPEEN